MDFEEVIKDNELEEVSSIELISIMNKVIEVLKERIDDAEEDDFDIELDEMETDELCELATAVMMVILERVDEDTEKDDDSNDNDSDKEEETYDKENDKDEELEEVDESYITEASIANAFARKLFSKGDDVVVLANKSDIAKGLKRVPKDLRKLPEFELLKTYTTSKKGFPPDKIDDLMNSPLKQYFEKYGNNRVKNGTLKTMTSGSTTIPTAKTKVEVPTTKPPQHGGTLYTLDTKGLPEGKTLYTLDPKKVDMPIKKEAIETIGKEKVINAATEMIGKDPDCIAISSKFGSRVAKSYAVIKYLLKIGVPVAAIGGGAMYVKGLLDNSSSSLEISDTTSDILPQDIPSNKDILKIEIPETPPKNNDEITITPDMISDDPSMINNYSERERDNKKPKRIKYAGLGELFNNIGSFVDDTGTSVGSGIGKTIGGLGK